MDNIDSGDYSDYGDDIDDGLFTLKTIMKLIGNFVYHGSDEHIFSNFLGFCF
jgi:hypothetical protein